MGKIKIQKSIAEGFNVIVRNPAIFVPAFIMAALNLFTDILFSNVPEPTETLSRDVLTYLIYSMMWFVIFFLISIFLTSVIIRIAYDAVNRKVSIVESTKIAVLKYPALLISTTIYFIIVGFGALAFIIPGIFLFIKLLYYQYAILLDDEGIINSLKRSWKITKENWWNNFIIGVFFSAIFIISAILSVIFEVLNLPVSSLIDFATNLFVLPWLISSMTFAYLQLTDREPTVSG